MSHRTRDVIVSWPLAAVAAMLLTASPPAATAAALQTPPVKAIEPWNDSQLDLVAGRTYAFKATGEWVDWFIPADANGYKRWYLAPWGGGRRAPKADWFALIGCVGKTLDHCFLIGADRQIKAPASGRLYLFANDLPRFYKNNRGELQLTITPLEGAADTPR